MHQALLLRRKRVPLEGFTFSWRCSWGTVCWHMLSYAAMFRHVELCSVIYFRSCHWCVDAIETDRKNTWNLLGWRWNFYNQKTQRICHCWISNVHVVSKHPNIRQLLIPNPRARSSGPRVIKKTTSCLLTCWSLYFDVFWGLVSFPKVCKKPPSYNNFQRKTTHPNHWALERFGAAAVAQRGSPGNEGKFPTQHIRGTWMHWGYNSQWRFSSLWNRKWVKCVASVFLEPAEGDDNVCMSLPATPWLVVHLFYHGKRVTLPRPRFLQGNRRKMTKPLGCCFRLHFLGGGGTQLSLTSSSSSELSPAARWEMGLGPIFQISTSKSQLWLNLLGNTVKTGHPTSNAPSTPYKKW